MRRAAAISGWIYSVAVLFFVLLPAAIMVPASFGASEALQFPPRALSFHWYSQVLHDRIWLSSAWLSLRLAGFASLLATIAGLLAALAQMRFGGIPIWLRACFMLPMVAPHIVLATGLFSLLLQSHLLGSAPVLCFGQACLAMPLAVIIMIGATDGVDPLLWTAGASLGARWWTILRQIVLPNLRFSLLACLLMAFVSAWDEVTFAVFIGPVATPTLTSRMFTYLQELINPSVTAVATMLMAVTLLLGSIGLILPRLRRLRGVA